VIKKYLRGVGELLHSYRDVLMLKKYLREVGAHIAWL
jgi:hypothetical protein